MNVFGLISQLIGIETLRLTEGNLQSEGMERLETEKFVMKNLFV